MVKGGCIIKVFITGIIIIEFLTLFRIGSVSKSLTATLIMRLVQEGILDLDVPIHTYIVVFLFLRSKFI
ncbi:serine hydrolase [Aneurinibacillus thermoaerophilus]|uniref:serine hydrolase n=1 Tax=Aneurinibacillus thermoaerophilus TaxID=143495 RepID=UPI002E22C080|nr:serine hydrolase [Aneurinibacillus thermoaerophilus]MED0766261.1 serine hydrolase [Aneurinibacillus thermoaerophilus]